MYRYSPSDLTHAAGGKANNCNSLPEQTWETLGCQKATNIDHPPYSCPPLPCRPDFRSLTYSFYMILRDMEGTMEDMEVYTH